MHSGLRAYLTYISGAYTQAFLKMFPVEFCEKLQEFV